MIWVVDLRRGLTDLNHLNIEVGIIVLFVEQA